MIRLSEGALWVTAAQLSWGRKELWGYGGCARDVVSLPAREDLRHLLQLTSSQMFLRRGDGLANCVCPLEAASLQCGARTRDAAGRGKRGEAQQMRVCSYLT